jgi:hypothetical protein
LTLYLPKKPFEKFVDKTCDAIYYFLYGLFCFAQFFFPTLVVYGIIDLIYQNNIGIIWVIVGAMFSYLIFRSIRENESETVFRKINNKLHLLGWKEIDGENN